MKKKLTDFLKSEKFNNVILPDTRMFLAVVFFTLIYGIGVSWFLDSIVDIRLYAGGMPGIVQLISDIVKVASGGYELPSFVSGIMIFVINIPVLLLGWFKVSKKFTIYSVVSVILQSTVIGFIPTPDFGFSNLEPIVSAVIGGLLIGIGAGGALRFGTSTGGFDIIGQYFSLHKGKSVGMITMALNVGVTIIGGLLYGSIETIAYTIIRILITTVVIDKIHTSYQFLSVEVITNDSQTMIDEILVKIHRGITIIRAEGAFSHSEKKILVIVISAYEMHSLIQIVRQIDSNAFITSKPVKNIYGNFKRKTIA